MAQVYRIRQWDNFENHESKKLKNLSWIAMPNKHDGRGFRRVAALPNSVQVFCAWTLMLQVASKMPTRGVLLDEDGALTAADLAAKTGFHERIFADAFIALIRPEIRWLEIVEVKISGESPGTPRNLPDEQKGTEGKGTEGQETPPGSGGERKRDALDIPTPLNTSQPFSNAWQRWMTIRRGLGRKPKDWNAMFSEQLTWLATFPPGRAVRILEQSMRNGWQGLFEKGTEDGNDKNNARTHGRRPERNTGTFNEKHAAGYTSEVARRTLDRQNPPANGIPDAPKPDATKDAG